MLVDCLDDGVSLSMQEYSLGPSGIDGKLGLHWM